MRGHAEYDEKTGEMKSGGTILFYWRDDGPHLILYRDWKGKPFEPGEEREVLWAFDVSW